MGNIIKMCPSIRLIYFLVFVVLFFTIWADPESRISILRETRLSNEAVLIGEMIMICFENSMERQFLFLLDNKDMKQIPWKMQMARFCFRCSWLSNLQNIGSYPPQSIDKLYVDSMLRSRDSTKQTVTICIFAHPPIYIPYVLYYSLLQPPVCIS